YPKYEEMQLLKEKIPDATRICYELQIDDKVEYGDNSLSGVNYYGNTENFDKIQKVNLGAGRYFQQADFDRGTPYVVLGYRIAERLFGKPEKSIGQTVKLRGGKTAIVVGIIDKQGTSLLGGWDYDNSI